MSIRSLTALPALALAFMAAGQKSGTALFTPVNWVQARYDHANHRFADEQGELLSEEYWTFPSSGKVDKNQRWTVFTDRAGVVLRTGPQSDAETASPALPFGQMLHVFKEEKGWLQVGREGDKAEGWCDKRQLVLWDKPLAEHLTRIELKAFLVNTLQGSPDQRRQGVEGELKQKYEVFDGPGPAAERRRTDYLYDVLYIYKYDKEGQRWLVGPSQVFSQAPLIGWVNARKVKVWPTRLCLEPNWEDVARAERRERNIRAKLLPYNSTAEEQGKYKTTGQGEGLVDGDVNDPAFDRTGLYGPRMDARLFRYPVLGATMDGDANCRFLTGVSGIMNLGVSGTLEGFRNADYLKTRRYYESMKEQKNVLAMVFVLEGSSDMREHIRTMKEAIAAMQRKCKDSGMTARYGVVQYFNEWAAKGDEPESAFIEQLPMTNDAEKVLSWLDQRKFENRGDMNDARAAYKALQLGIAMLEKGRTNIVVHICRRPDNVRDDPTFGGKSLIDPTDLASGLDMGRATHYLGYVTGGSTPAMPVRREAYAGMAEDVMANLATAVSNQLKGVIEQGKDSKGRAAAPTIINEKKGGNETARMDRFHFVMKATLLADGIADVHTIIAADVAECLDKSQQAFAALEQVVEDRQMISDHATEFTYFYGQLATGGATTQETLDYLAQEKVHVFENAVTWYKVADLKQQLFRYVLFYDDRSLSDEIRALDKLIYAMEKANIDEARMELRNIWRERAQNVMGSKFSEKVPISEIQAKLMGIHALSMVKPFEQASLLKGLTLDDLADKSKFNSSLLEGYKKMAIANKERLTAMKTKGEYYQVPGHEERKDERRYYWVPIEYLFN
jgi:hypothetical protein